MRQGIKRNKEFYFKTLIDKMTNMTYAPNEILLTVNGASTKIISE